MPHTAYASPEGLKKIGVALVAGGLAGSFVGVIEAVYLLLQVGAGEYDALLWGGVAYGLVGMFLAIPCSLVGYRWRKEVLFARTMTFVGWLVVIWLTKSLLSMVGFLLLYWILVVVVTRTPLRVLLHLKGAMVFALLWVGLLSVFSLTPSRRIFTPPAHGTPSLKHPNILIVVLDGFSMQELEGSRFPKLTSLSKKTISFSNAFANSPMRFGTLSGLLTGEPTWSSSPLREEVTTLPEYLALEGFQTIGMVSHLAVGRFANLHQGFDEFRYAPPILPNVFLRIGLGNEGTRHLKLVKSILTQFDIQPRNPIDVVQLFAHERQRFSMKPEAKSSPLFQLLHVVLPDTLSEHQSQDFDRVMSELIQQLRQERETIVLLTGVPSQTQQYPIDVHVPLVIWLPTLVERRINNNVQLSDLPMTLAGLLGIPAHSSWNGANALRLPPRNDGRQISIHSPYLQWAQQGDWRWMQWKGQEGLFNVREDPQMQRNVIHSHPEVYKVMSMPRRDGPY